MPNQKTRMVAARNAVTAMAPYGASGAVSGAPSVADSSRSGRSERSLKVVTSRVAYANRRPHYASTVVGSRQTSSDTVSENLRHAVLARARPATIPRLREGYADRVNVNGRTSRAASGPRSTRTIVVAGASGLVGRALVGSMEGMWDVTVLTRRIDGSEPTGARAVAWDPTAAARGDEEALLRVARVLDGADALVNLAGSSIAAGRFGRRHRASIERSRIESTTTLVEAARRADVAPATWLQASAVGAYGDRGDEILDEASSIDDGVFLGAVGRAWEASSLPAAARSRLVIARFGVVFDRHAAAWTRLLAPIRWGLGGPLGSGRQWWPWVHARDVTRALTFLLEHDVGKDGTTVTGVYNVTAPHPARQIDVARAAARALGRPCWLPVPAFALRVVVGGLADHLLLPSARVVPARLTQAGFTFAFDTIDEAARDLVGPPPSGDR